MNTSALFCHSDLVMVSSICGGDEVAYMQDQVLHVRICRRRKCKTFPYAAGLRTDMSNWHSYVGATCRP